VGDFNGDSKDDLAAGIPLERVRRSDGSAVERAGIVQVLYGTDVGLNSDRDGFPSMQFWHQDSIDEGSEIEDVAELDDRFGQALAAGDFDGDGSDDLAVAATSEDVGTIANAGAVNVIYGSSDQGLDASGDEVFDQDRSGIDDAAETSDRFGTELAAWNFGSGAEDDLAVAVPTEGETAAQAGLVHAIYGDRGSGLTSSGSQVWVQGTSGVADSSEGKDTFGWSLAR
jgi:hypothetical protein